MECQSVSPNSQLVIDKHTLRVPEHGHLSKSLDRATGCDAREVAKIGALLPATGTQKSPPSQVLAK